ncbi:type I phosphodiesterase / nucleotide pyrophosphatase family protein [Aspergillus nomiae NRRL 13137]|uniref:Type I phosphodiesterase / nucleotide pyrophosphatase family protein n=1 Tax=Aspergillus nomiae NRRL (strain ATCC 15546 / NRRL 13137 / CBS 260.88 / M93) TaxID=1509407 RepID=A0A0L1IUH1_ASPN3|nr:type I phosphodiesterase / nucleotide pyrophosphatase family protein [Aspergillus nomiae NRRL 13137]KNG83060.1 type I phosphodiesterase / nucleotide pyrophosphatase family protein [Aspergillus nomiae NRRL 13137]
MPTRRDIPSHSLLSPGDYDEDAESLRSPSEQDSDSEDDEFLRRSRTTLELAEHDRMVLNDEEETEKLLIRGGPTHGLRRIFSLAAQVGQHEKMTDSGELMFEMEEGHREDDESSLLSRSSSDLDRQLKEYGGDERPQRVSWLKLALVFAAIFVLFLIFLLGAYKASTSFRTTKASQTLLSNGTALFAPTTILISLDGFRADFLNRGLTPTLNKFIAEGVSPQYMLPSFPSVTFPNHFTLVTGLYPESHGIVGNTFWDPELQEEFYYTHPSVSMQPKWWNAEPLWMAAENQGIKTAIHMWPGSEAHIGGVEPTMLDKYNGSEALPRKANRILEFLDMSGLEDESGVVSDRPQFIAAYVPNVDADGHKYGPNSTEIRGTISEVDEMLGSLFAGLQDRNLTDIVNIVIVSDHGMATTATERLVQLDDLIDLSLVDRIDGWPLRGLRPKRPEDLETLQKQLESVAVNYSHALEIYTRETMPERYHFTNNDRIAPLWVIPKTGWAVVERPDFDAHSALEKGEVYHPRGVHGYDHEHSLMRAIFIARGPAFPHQPNSRVEVFQNINVYNIICDTLGLDPRPNNGTLRLPLKPVGLHSDEDTPALENPSDPPASSTATPVSPSMTSTALASTSPTTTSTTAPEAPPEEESDDEADNDNDQPSTWWGTLWDKIEDLKDWAGDLIETVKDNFP